jgi:hypothetical protein
VLVEIPTASVKYEYVDSRYHRYYIVPSTNETPFYTKHPSCQQRGGVARSKIYHSAYEASLKLDTSGNIKLQSIAGKQPFTGAGIYKLAFTSGGTTQIQVGNTITGGTSTATGIVEATHLSSGTWAGGDAAGFLYIRQKTGTFVTGEPILVSSVDLGTTGDSGTAVNLNLTLAEGYANAIGSGFGIVNIWTKRYIDMLQIIEAGTLNIPSVFGRGIVELASGTGFAGKLTGADSIDSRIDINGTGSGSGTDGQTPIKWRGIENLYGNVWKHVVGFNVFTDGSYRLLKRDGTGAIAEIMASGSYETGTETISTADGYIVTITSEELGALAFVPKSAGTTGASSSTYFCDKHYGPSSANNSSLYSGAWQTVSESGPFLMSNSSINGANNAALGTHFEYIPQA